MREPDVDAFPSEDSPDPQSVPTWLLTPAGPRGSVTDHEERDWSKDWPTEFLSEDPEVPVTLFDWDGVKEQHRPLDLDGLPPMPDLLPPRAWPPPRRLAFKTGVAIVAGGLCIAVGIASGLAIARRVPATPRTSPQDADVASLAKPDVTSVEPSLSPSSSELPPPLSTAPSSKVSRPAPRSDLASRTSPPPAVPVDRPSVVAPRPRKAASAAAPSASAQVAHQPADPSPPATMLGVAADRASGPPIAGPGATRSAPKATELPPSKPPDPLPAAVSAPPVSAAPVNAAPATAAIDASANPPVSPPSAEASIRAVLDAYRLAYDQRDADAVASAWPGANTKALSKAFEQLDEQSLQFDSCAIHATGTVAEAACTGTAMYVPRVGKRTEHADARKWSFQFRQVKGVWVIASVTAR